MPSIIDRPLSGISDVLGLAPGNQLRKQIRANILLYELCLENKALKPSAVQLETLINRQVLRLRDIDNAAGRFRSRATFVFAFTLGTVLVASAISLHQYWPNIWAIVFTFILGFAGVLFGIVAFAARIGQDRLEEKRKKESEEARGSDRLEEEGCKGGR